jgi:hypothetical protein
MRDYVGMRSKYPKWAHRRDEHKKRKRKSKRKRRRSRGRRRRAAGTSTEGMLVSLMHQLMLRPQTLAKKHGENVLTQYGGIVKPGVLSNVWSRQDREERKADWYAKHYPGAGRGRGAGAGAGAAAAIGPVGPPPRARSPSPRRGGYPAEFFRA